jgi:hypothetical protein
MKLKSCLIALFLFGVLSARAQEKNTLSVFYGISNSNIDIHNAIGDYGYSQRPGTGFGFTYNRALNRFFSIETGFAYANDKTQLSVIEAGLGNIYTNEDLKLISIPLRAKFTFFKYLFADAGFSYDKQTNYRTGDETNDQSGLGGEVGVGAQFQYAHILIFVNPYYKTYRITSVQNNLYEQGLKFGIGYKF